MIDCPFLILHMFPHYYYMYQSQTDFQPDQNLNPLLCCDPMRYLFLLEVFLLSNLVLGLAIFCAYI